MAIKQENSGEDEIFECKITAESETYIEDNHFQDESELYVTRLGWVSHPPTYLIETAYAVIKETYCHNFSKGGDDKTKEIVERTYAMNKALLF